MGALKTTVLTGYEVELGAKMTPRGGWNTALYYSEGIIAEHLHTRSACSVFDLCSDGKFRVAGEGAAAVLDALYVRPSADLAIGQARRNLLLARTGGVVDCPLVLRMAETDFLVLSGAETAAAEFAWLSAAAGERAEVQDLSQHLACLGLEGPLAEEVLDTLNIEELPEHGRCKTIGIDGFRAIAVRAGSTGEDGFRLLFNVEYADQLWDLLLETGPVMPAGFGALDSLRLEMGYPACGHELTPEFSPLDSGLGALVRLDDGREFTGKAALLAAQPAHALVGLVLETRRAAREGVLVLNEKEEVVGKVTSGSFCPTLEASASLCRIDLECLPGEGAKLLCEVIDTRLPGVITGLPFYSDGSAKGEFFLP